MEYIVFLLVVIVVLILVSIEGYRSNKKFEKWMRQKLKELYGKPSTYKIDYDALFHFTRFYEKHKEDLQIDDITWNDLAMDRLFEQINYTQSSCGEEYLYYRLRTPIYDKQVLEDFEKKVQFFMEHEENRLDAQFAFSRMGKLGKYSLYDYLDHLNDIENISNLNLLLWDFAIVPAFGIMYLSIPIGIMAVTAVILHNILTYFKKKKKIDPYITSFAYIFRMLSALQEMEKAFDGCGCEEELKVLASCKKALRSFKVGSFVVMNARTGTGVSNPLEMIVDYLCMVFSVDLLKFNQMLACVRQNLPEIEACLKTLGYMETVIATGMYRAALLNGYCIPELGCGEAMGEAIYHPMLTKPVKNSVSLEHNVLLTGSNASGKSTFLKSVAINLLLAQTIHTCTADKFKAPFSYLMSSMNLSDSIEEGDSYYIAEIKAIRRVFEFEKKDNITVYCFLDEVLRGTNTVERIAAATQILEELAKQDVKCFAATHDIELTELLKDAYDMYHFEENVVDGDVHFSYELLDGKATTRNAIKLLQLMGFDSKLIEKAEQRASTFVSQNVWK